MRLAAWNIQSGGGSRIPGIATVLAEVGAEVCVLSEYTNARSDALTDALANVGLPHTLHTDPEARWGGVFVASRTPIRLGDVGDCPSPDRWLHVVGDDLPVEIGAAYIPNAERSKTEKTEYWDWLLGVGDKVLSRDVLITGDFNTGLHRIDEEGATFVCADRMARIPAGGWTDGWRLHHGDARESTWWSHRGNGFRLDHALLSPSARARCSGAEYLTSVGDRCIVHPQRRHDGCDLKPLSDHAMLVVEVV